jgi:hypothetical protein
VKWKTTFAASIFLRAELASAAVPGSGRGCDQNFRFYKREDHEADVRLKQRKLSARRDTITQCTKQKLRIRDPKHREDQHLQLNQPADQRHIRATNLPEGTERDGSLGEAILKKETNERIKIWIRF